MVEIHTPFKFSNMFGIYPLFLYMSMSQNAQKVSIYLIYCSQLLHIGIIGFYQIYTICNDGQSGTSIMMNTMNQSKEIHTKNIGNSVVGAHYIPTDIDSILTLEVQVANNDLAHFHIRIVHLLEPLMLFLKTPISPSNQTQHLITMIVQRLVACTSMSILMFCQILIFSPLFLEVRKWVYVLSNCIIYCS